METIRDCNGNPINKIDPSGHKAGDLFGRMNDAAKDFAKIWNPISINQNIEYSTFIYKVEKRYYSKHKPPARPIGGGAITTETIYTRTFYSYVAPKKGTSGESSPPINWFGAKKKVAHAHTHGAYDKKYDNDNFSPADREVAKKKNVHMYVATPVGYLKRFDPPKLRVGDKYNWDERYGKNIIAHIPSDPNHPKNKKK